MFNEEPRAIEEWPDDIEVQNNVSGQDLGWFVREIPEPELVWFNTVEFQSNDGEEIPLWQLLEEYHLYSPFT